MIEDELPGYSALEEIGRGGFSRVYRCQQDSFKRTVALKVLDAVQQQPGADARFERECLAIGSLHWHPNIVTVFDAGVTAHGHPYIVMEYAPRGSIAARLDRERKLAEPEALAIAAKIASALQAAHDIGVVHRDVTPANILVGTTGEPLLADFGIASVTEAPATATGNITATVAYTAPEVLNGERPSPSSDIYSLGATLFAMLAGHPPFSVGDDTSLAGLVARSMMAPLPDLRQVGISADAAAVVEHALARNPLDRFRTAADFEAALAAVLGRPAPVNMPTAPTPPTPLARQSDTAADAARPHTVVFASSDVSRTPASIVPPPPPPAATPVAPRRSGGVAVGAIVAASIIVAGLLIGGVVLIASRGDSPKVAATTTAATETRATAAVASTAPTTPATTAATSPPTTTAPTTTAAPTTTSVDLARIRTTEQQSSFAHAPGKCGPDPPYDIYRPDGNYEITATVHLWSEPSFSSPSSRAIEIFTTTQSASDIGCPTGQGPFVHVLCVTTGERVAGPFDKDGNAHWERVLAPDGQKGFVPDEWLDTKKDRNRFALC